MQSIKIQHEAFAIFRFYSCKYRDGVTGGYGGGGGLPLTFLEEKCFCLSIRYML